MVKLGIVFLHLTTKNVHKKTVTITNIHETIWGENNINSKSKRVRNKWRLERKKAKTKKESEIR